MLFIDLKTERNNDIIISLNGVKNHVIRYIQLHNIKIHMT